MVITNERLHPITHNGCRPPFPMSTVHSPLPTVAPGPLAAAASLSAYAALTDAERRVLAALDAQAHNADAAHFTADLHHTALLARLDASDVWQCLQRLRDLRIADHYVIADSRGVHLHLASWRNRHRLWDRLSDLLIAPAPQAPSPKPQASLE
ncbi:MAG: hypothetical protein BroJett004_08150 [Planctomycetota bacterium]|nr:MAG: hypothetical protein BroJett004_08150 [Planctomycetota bacterium]